MSKYRRAAKIDISQPEIVRDLRRAGVQVVVDHDDLLVGYNGRTLWVEIKQMDTWRVNGCLKSGTFKDSQVDLLKTWTGDFMVAWTSEQILSELGILKGTITLTDKKYNRRMEQK